LRLSPERRPSDRTIRSLMTIEKCSNSWRGTLIAYAPLIFWTLVVLGFSTGQASMSETSLFIVPVLKYLFPSASDTTITLYHGYIRKCAHFTEYAILAFFAWRAFTYFESSVLKKLLAPIVFVALIACLDEFNQSFSPLRTSSGRDVLLDISGGMCMTFFLFFLTNKRARS